MNLVVGLGNPGERYQNTRHNTGFILLDHFAKKKGLSWTLWNNSLISKEIDFTLLKPQTFMNNSGDAVSSYYNYHLDRVLNGNLIIVHDDVDLEFGQVKVQFSQGSAGHKGVQSIIDSLGKQLFWRIRIGIGRPTDENISIEDFVLTPFTQKEYENIIKIDIESYLGKILKISSMNIKS